MTTADPEFHDLLGGFIRLHILHHATEGAIYGQWMIDELAQHGYRLSPGTLYPMLRGMEARGYLTSRREEQDRAGRPRQFYVATDYGRRALAEARHRLRELIGEVS